MATQLEPSSTIDQPLLPHLARVAPLDPLPFEQKLLEAVAEDHTENAHEFAQQVLSYQPRSLAARLYLLTSAARREDFDVVFNQYEGLVRLRSLNDALLTDALIGIFREGGDWSPLLEYLGSRPPKGDLLARKILAEPVQIEKIADIMQKYPSVMGQYLKILMREGFDDEAYELWKSYSGVHRQDLDALPFNGTFAVREELPPFNWFIDYGRAEIQPVGGLHVTYLGRGNPEIAQQVMAAPPGDYLLQTKATGRMPAKGGALELLLTCHGKRTPIARSNIVLAGNLGIEAFETEVNIPREECGFQTLQLFGRPGEFPKTSRTEVLSLEMIPVR